MKKRIFLIAVIFQAFVLAFGACGGAFSFGTIRADAAAEPVRELSASAPEDLEGLRSASDEQLDLWAEQLSAFDGRDYGYVTSAKNQYDKNICWAYAAVGAAEASILREGIDPDATKANLDLDEYVAAYLRFNRDGQHDPLLLTANDRFSGNWNRGDFTHNVFATMSQGFSPVLQKTSYYSTDETIKSFVSESEYFVQSYFRIERSPEAIKRAILRYGAVAIEYRAPEGYYNYYYNANGNSTNHASIIVGWDDNVDRSSFYPNKPSGNGAWIVKNSWGYGHGTDPNGRGARCYYLSYDSYLTSNLYVIDLAMKEDYRNLYFYDGQITTSGTNYLTDAQAAIYEAKLSDSSVRERLKAVTVVSEQSNVTANVKIYRHLNVNPGNVNDRNNLPDQGDPVAERDFHIERPGYYTIDLETPVMLEQGEYFSIVVGCKNAYGSAVPLACAIDSVDSVNDMTYYQYNGVWTSYKGDPTSYADSGNRAMSAKIRAVTDTVPRETELGNDLRYARVEIPNRLIYYARGKRLTPEVRVYFGDKLLTEERDYSVTFEGNAVPGMATVRIEGRGDYSGTRTTSFEVARPKYPPKVMEKTVTVYNNVTRLHQIPIPVDWEWIDGDCDLALGHSYFAYSLRYVGEDANFYQITTCDFYVDKVDADPPAQIDLSDAEVSVVGSYSYTGSPIVPEIKVICEGLQLHAGADYTVSCRDNLDAGQATATVTGRGSYCGQCTLSFRIERADLPEVRPNETLFVSRRAATLAEVDLGVEGWDWSDPGQTIGDGLTATAVYRGADAANYITTEIPIRVERVARKELSELTDLRLEATRVVYNGSEQTPEVIAFDGTTPLCVGVDFSVRYQDNRNAGTGAIVTVTGLNDYIGSVTLGFTIDRAERTDFAVSQEGWTFGESEPPLPSHSGEGEPAAVRYLYAEEKDGPYTADRPIDAGTYWVKAIIEASQNYNAKESTASFSIAPADLSGFVLTVEGENFVCNGQALKPLVSVTNGTVVLTEEDYSVSYENNVAAGFATVTVRGRRNYTGTLTATFEIFGEPEPPSAPEGEAAPSGEKGWLWVAIAVPVAAVIAAAIVIAVMRKKH